jgi:hypothetical protein
VLSALGITHPPTKEWPRVWWVPGGLLGQLPIHAAGHYPGSANHADGRTVMDRALSSYTPTIRALHHARQKSLASSGDLQLLIVAMPTTRGASDLTGVAAEVKMVSALLPRPVMLSDGPGSNAPPTKTAVLAHLPGTAVVHFACHGRNDPADPSRSVLLLKDHREDPLTVASLSAVALTGVRLAYLSACATSRTDRAELRDEAIHLSSAFQLAGSGGEAWSMCPHIWATSAVVRWERSSQGLVMAKKRGPLKNRLARFVTSGGQGLQVAALRAQDVGKSVAEACWDLPWPVCALEVADAAELTERLGRRPAFTSAEAAGWVVGALASDLALWLRRGRECAHGRPKALRDRR